MKVFIRFEFFLSFFVFSFWFSVLSSQFLVLIFMRLLGLYGVETRVTFDLPECKGPFWKKKGKMKRNARKKNGWKMKKMKNQNNPKNNKI